MNKEEKEAIKNAKEVLKFTTYLADIGHKDLEILLNLIQKQEAIIDKMAEQLAGLVIWKDEEDVILGDKQEVKEYFKKEVEKE